ncbi:MAG TPA: TadE family protein [Allosphingosinicella sp.]|uniref:TadE family protein n=1 Tax=Allosphingosinicella sp. TaxID=2823234 RepID=UPI002ED78264
MSLIKNSRGASALEFALVVPGLVFLLNGIAQLGIVYFANAGLNDALAAGSRYLTLHRYDKDDFPTAGELEVWIKDRKWGLDPDNLTISSTSVSTAANGSRFVDITMGYDVTLNFIFIDVDPIELSQTRRAYIYADSAPAA